MPSASASEDDYGNEIPGDPTEVETVCELQQRRRDEPDAQGEMSATDWVAFFKPDEDLGDAPTSNTLEVDGQVFEFVGDPWTVRDPFNQEASHIEASVERAG